MYEIQKKNTLLLHKKYKLSTLPIPLWEIEQMIIDRGFDICISIKSKVSFILNTTVFVPNLCDSHTRFCLGHELGHIIGNHYDIYNVDKHTKRKYETQADAFALYLIMPPGRFEREMSRLNEWELSEKFGIPVEYIIKRVSLITETKIIKK